MLKLIKLPGALASSARTIASSAPSALFMTTAPARKFPESEFVKRYLPQLVSNHLIEVFRSEASVRNKWDSCASIARRLQTSGSRQLR